MKKTIIQYESMAASMLSKDEITVDLLGGFDLLDQKLLRAIALIKLIEENKIPLDLARYKKDFEELQMTTEFARDAYAAMIKLPRKTFGIADFWDEKIDLVMFTISQYIANKYWPEAEFMGGFGCLYHQKGSLFGRPEIYIHSDDMAKIYFRLEYFFDYEYILEQFPKVGLLLSNINDLEKKLMKKFRSDK